ncbi:MAG: NADH-quinone oxidoreductase subunit A [Bacteroidota bacterium]
MDSELSQFAYILLFIIGGIVLVVVGLFTSFLLRPKQPNPEKLSTYECGEEPLGQVWGQFNNQYYVIALIFILFEVEIIFLFPWALIFGQAELSQASQGAWGWFALTEMFIFIGLLGLGLAYVWIKGYLDWVRPQENIKKYKSPVPSGLYEKFNEGQNTRSGRVDEVSPSSDGLSIGGAGRAFPQ